MLALPTTAFADPQLGDFIFLLPQIFLAGLYLWAQQYFWWVALATLLAWIFAIIFQRDLLSSIPQLTALRHSESYSRYTVYGLWFMVYGLWFSNVTQWVKSATSPIARFSNRRAQLFLLAENDYVASSRLAIRPEKSTLGPVQLRI